MSYDCQMCALCIILRKWQLLLCWHSKSSSQQFFLHMFSINFLLLFFLASIAMKWSKFVLLVSYAQCRRCKLLVIWDLKFLIQVFTNIKIKNKIMSLNCYWTECKSYTPYYLTLWWFFRNHKWIKSLKHIKFM